MRYNLKLRDIYKGAIKTLNVYIYEKNIFGKCLYIDPFKSKFTENIMLRSNYTECSQYVLDILPILFEHGHKSYRRSHYAFDFCFCLPIMPCANKNKLDGSYGIDYNLEL